MIRNLKTRTAVFSVGLLTLAGGLTACTGGSSTPAPTVTVTSEAQAPLSQHTPSPSATETKRAEAKSGAAELENGRLSDASFADLMRQEQPVIAEKSDEVIVNLAKASCSALDKGASPLEVLEAATSAEASSSMQEALYFVVGGGVANYCPEYVPDFQRLSS